MRENPHADYAFVYRGADTSAWGFTMKADASIVKIDSNASFSPLTRQPNDMRENPHADYAFIDRGADTSAWGVSINEYKAEKGRTRLFLIVFVCFTYSLVTRDACAL